MQGTEGMKTTPRVKRSARQSCVFRSRFIREEIDPRVKVLWERTTGQSAPFGRLRMNFQREHCRAINPYGGECPYREEECGTAFLAAVQNSLLPWITDPAAYFVKVARSSGIERADNKPLAREMHREQTGSGNTGDVRGGHGPRFDGDLAVVRSSNAIRDIRPEEDNLRRSHARPIAIGDLLGSIDPRPRQGPADDGKASPE